MSSASFARSANLDRAHLTEEIAARRARLRQVMEEQEVDAILVASEANVAYLTGYETTIFGNRSKPFIVVLTPDETTVVCHVGDEPGVALDAIDVQVAPYVGPRVVHVHATVQIDYQLDAAATALQLIETRKLNRVGLELSWHFLPGFTPAAMDLLRGGLDQGGCDASAALWTVRRRKSAWEIERMRAAADVADRTYRSFAATVEIGMSEKEISRLLRRTAYDLGAEKIGYSGVIAGVDRAPQGGPTDRRLESGQLLLVDVCLQLQGGYFADFNRVLATGDPTPPQRRAYAKVVDALAHGRELLRPGTSVSQLAQAMIGTEATIYARAGHGLGLELLEPPSLTPQDDSPLTPGEVICIEPNTFVDGVGWLVSEEEVVITADGYERLSPAFPEHLAVIGSS